VLKTDESEGKILKIFLKSVEILFRVWKHICVKNYFEILKKQVSKFDCNFLNF